MEFVSVNKFTLLDYPEKVACVLYTQACNFQCPYCHNYETLVKGNVPQIPFDEILSFLKKRVGILDGVVISGGEPTLMKDLPEKIKKIKELGYLVKLDTNGSNPEMLKSLIDEKLIDYVSMDIKTDLLEAQELADVFSKYPLRTFDCGISEEHSAVFAASLGVNGYHPYLFMYSTFLQRAYDEIIHDITRLNVPCTILIDRAGLVGADGETHQGIYDDSFFFSIPNIALAMPHDVEDAKKLFEIAKTYEHPFAIRFTPNYKYEEDDFVSTKPIKFGAWDVVKKSKNKKNIILSLGPHINDIYRAFKDNDEVTIVNALFMKEYNEEEILKLSKYKKVYVYDPYGVETGFCSNILLNLNKVGFKGKIRTRAIPLQYLTKGTKAEQEKRISVDVESFIADFNDFINQ